MAEVRVGGAYIDWRSRNAQFLTGLDKNKRAMREQRRALQSLRGHVDRFNAVARQIPLILAGAAAGMAVLVRPAGDVWVRAGGSEPAARHSPLSVFSFYSVHSRARESPLAPRISDCNASQGAWPMPLRGTNYY